MPIVALLGRSEGLSGYHEVHGSEDTRDTSLIATPASLHKHLLDLVGTGRGEP